MENIIHCAIKTAITPICRKFTEDNVMTNRLSALALALTLASMCSSALAFDYIKIDIDPPKETPHLDDPPSKGDHSADIEIGDKGGKGGPADPNGGALELTSDIVDALGPIDPGPLSPKAPGGIIEVDDTPQIVILDDGVGSNGPGGSGPDGKTSPGALVIRLACTFSPDGLVIRNVGEVDAPMGLKLKWQARGLKLDGVVRLDKTLRVGHAASLGGVAANGAACGIELAS